VNDRNNHVSITAKEELSEGSWELTEEGGIVVLYFKVHHYRSLARSKKCRDILNSHFYADGLDPLPMLAVAIQDFENTIRDFENDTLVPDRGECVGKLARSFGKQVNDGETKLEPLLSQIRRRKTKIFLQYYGPHDRRNHVERATTGMLRMSAQAPWMGLRLRRGGIRYLQLGQAFFAVAAAAAFLGVGRVGRTRDDVFGWLVREIVGSNYYATAPELIKDGVLNPFGLSGIKDFPMSRAITRDVGCVSLPVGEVGEVSDGVDTFNVPVVAPEEAKQRLGKAGFDMRFQFRGYNTDLTLTRTFNSGRVWNWKWSQSIGTADLLGDWGAGTTTLAPAFAGLASSVVDTGVTSSWASLLAHFGEGATPANSILTSHVRNRHNAQVNPVRFVMRLAIMYMMASTLEIDGDSLAVQRATWPDVRDISLTAHVSRLLDDTRMGSGCVYLNGSYDSLISQEELTVLYIACSTDPIWRLNGDHSLAHFWPVMPQMILAYSQIQFVNIVPQASAAAIWRTAVLWCGRYSTVALFRECIHFVATIMMSPKANSPILLGERGMIHLPVARMEGYGLGPLIQPMSEAEHADYVEPSIPALLGETIPQAMFLGLVHLHSLWHGVLTAVQFGDLNVPDAQLAFRRYTRSMNGSSHSKWLAAYITKYDGASGTLGRLLGNFLPALAVNRELGGKSRHRGAISASKFFSRIVRAEDNLQWEEVALTGLKMPLESTIWGYIYPMCIKEGTYQRTGWGLPKNFAAGRSLAEACTSVHGVGLWQGSSAVWRFLAESANGMRTTISLPIRMSGTTGRAMDYSFRAYRSKTETIYTPIFQVRDPEYVRFLSDSACYVYHLKWYTESVGVTAVSGLSTAEANSGAFDFYGRGRTWIQGLGGLLTDLEKVPLPDEGEESDGSRAEFEEDLSDSELDIPGVPSRDDFLDGKNLEKARPGRKVDASITAFQEIQLTNLREYFGDSIAPIASNLEVVLRTKPLSLEDADKRERAQYALLTQIQGMRMPDLLLNVPSQQRGRAAKLLAGMIGTISQYGTSSPEVTKDLEVVAQAARNLGAAMTLCPALTQEELKKHLGDEGWNRSFAKGYNAEDVEIKRAAMAGIAAGNLFTETRVRTKVLEKMAKVWREELMADMYSNNPVLGSYLAKAAEERLDEAAVLHASKIASLATQSFLGEGDSGPEKTGPAHHRQRSVEDASSATAVPLRMFSGAGRGKNKRQIQSRKGEKSSISGLQSPSVVKVAQGTSGKKSGPAETGVGKAGVSTQPVVAETTTEIHRAPGLPAVSAAEENSGQQAETRDTGISLSGEKHPAGLSGSSEEIGDAPIVEITFVDPRNTETG